MLVLTRKEGERVRVTNKDGKLIGTVDVASVRGERVRLAFDFPREIVIDREEVAVEKEVARTVGGAK